MTDKKQPKKADKPAAKPATKAFALITNQAELNGAIKSIAGRAQRLDTDIHRAACSVIVHSAKHNDPDVATRLLEAMGKSQRREALKAWLVNYGAFGTDEHGKLVYDKSRSAAVQKEDNVRAAIAEPFWDFAGPEKPYKQWDFMANIQRLLKQAEAALQNPQQDTSLVPPDKLAALRAVVAGSAVVAAPAEESAEG